MGEVRGKLTRTDSAAENVKHADITHGGTQAGRQPHTDTHTGRKAEKERHTGMLTRGYN